MEHLKKYWLLYLAGLIILIFAIRYFRKKKNGGENGPKEGDTKVENGKTYIYKCQQVECATAPCPPVCNWEEQIENPPASTNLKIVNKKGAEIYQQEADGSMKGTGSTVSKDIVLSYTNKVNAGYCPKNSQVCLMPKDLYETSSGWLLETDITII